MAQSILEAWLLFGLKYSGIYKNKHAEMWKLWAEILWNVVCLIAAIPSLQSPLIHPLAHLGVIAEKTLLFCTYTYTSWYKKKKQC